MSHERKNPPHTWRGDLSGGVTAAVIALPLSVAFGVATLAPLGPEYAPVGAVAGLTTAVVACFVASLVGGTAVQITGPTGPMTVVLTAVVAMLVADPPPAATPEAQVAAILTLTLLTALLGGIVQIVLGVLGVGSLVKYIPYPVTAGFMNGIAVIILMGQAGPFLGFGAGASWSEGLLAGDVSIPVVLVGVGTVSVTALMPKLTTRFPAALAGLLVGVALFYTFRAAGYPMSAVVGTVPSGVPMPTQVSAFLGVFGDPALLGQVPRILGSAVALGVLGSIDSLLTSVVADVVTGEHHDSRRELIGQGLGNMASACFGGLAGAGTTVATLVNVNAGGRTPRAGMMQSAMLLGVMALAAPLAGAIPLVVLAGILVVTALGMIDGWSRALLVKAVSRGTSTPSLWINLGIVALVTVVTVSVDLMVAVAVGLAVAAVVFVGKMGPRVVRRVRTGSVRHSFKDRTPEELGILEREGDRIAVLELDGALFFGSSHALVQQVEELPDVVDYVILDARRLAEIDGSGARTLQQLHDQLLEEGKELAISFVTNGSAMWTFLGEMGDVEVLGEDHFFVDTDHALEWAEDRILAIHCGLHDEDGVPYEEMAVVDYFTDDQREALRGYLGEVDFDAGQRLYSAGSVDRCLWILSAGTLAVLVPCEEECRDMRITTVRAGHIVGERGFFTGASHTFHIEAATRGKAFVLTCEAFEKMREERPDLALGLLYNLGRELSTRIHAIGKTVASI